MRIRHGLRAGLLLALLALLTVLASGADHPWGLCYQASTQAGETTDIYLQEARGEQWLFLPASADLEALTWTFEGETATLTAGGSPVEITSGEPFSLIEAAGGQTLSAYPVELRREEETLSFTVMRSENLRSLYVKSADPEKDRTWVEKSKDNKAKKGGIALLRADGSLVYSGKLKNIKGRGNYTWTLPKRPYQIKLQEEADLLETGDPAEAESTWVLLANYVDGSLIHNQITLDLAAETGLPYSPHSAQIDLYYDGEYRGTYQLCEKTEISHGRVALRNLEAEIEAENPEVEDFDELPTVTVEKPDGSAYQYVSGITTPVDISGGYLLELDFMSRALEEKTWFRTTRGRYVVVKSPEYLSEEAVQYIAGYYQRFEDAIYNFGINPDTGEYYTRYVDLNSLAACYLLLELAEDADAFATSTFFYKPEGEEILYAGPLWDFDTSYDSADFDRQGYVAGRASLGRQLLRMPLFRETVKSLYQNTVQGLVEDVLLSGDPEARGDLLRSIRSYIDECAASRAMNNVVWPEPPARDAETACEKLTERLDQRNQWLGNEIRNWTRAELVMPRFLDVTEEDWFSGAVEYTCRNGLFSGMTGARFEPHTYTTRAMFVTVLYRLAGKPGAAGSVSFTDVKKNTWYSEALIWAAENGVISGYGDGTFGPTVSITREQMMSILYRYCQMIGMDMSARADLSGFRDADKISSYARDAMSWAVAKGLLYGEPGGYLNPKGRATRAQAAAVIMRCDMLP